MVRFGFLIYGVLSYLVFFGVFLYAIGFIGNFGVPKSIDGVAQLATLQALLIDLGLLMLFAVQHSLMARPFFKKWWTRLVPEAVERSTYVLFSSIALMALFYYWEPLGGLVWQAQSAVAVALLYALYGAGWVLVLTSTFLINHFDLFGLRQVFLNFKRQRYTPLPFKMPWLYRLVRHPLYVGWLIVFWAAPTMTVTHLLFALATSTYILLALRWEERDLRRAHPEYAQYQAQVPALVPFTKRKPSLVASGVQTG